MNIAPPYFRSLYGMFSNAYYYYDDPHWVGTLLRLKGSHIISHETFDGNIIMWAIGGGGSGGRFSIIDRDGNSTLDIVI